MKTKDYALMNEQTSREESNGSAMRKYKMSTTIPASITTPDTVDTSIGTLRFFDGFPDDCPWEGMVGVPEALWCTRALV